MNPLAVIKNLEAPVLVMQGTRDLQVPEAQAKLLAQAGGINAQLGIIENMNHVLKTVKEEGITANMRTYKDPDKPLNQELIKMIVDFIQSK